MADVEKIAAELRAGLEGVTPGPWEVGSWRDMIYSTDGGVWTWICRVKRNEDEATDSNQDVIDAAYIVAANPENIRALLDELSRLREALEPFARADRAIGDEPGPFRFETERGYRLVEREHFRAAARALSEREGQE